MVPLICVNLEFAVIVADSMTHRGIGPMLMQYLIDYPASRGIREIFGDVPVESTAMLDLCRHLGFRIAAVVREGRWG
ncbi:MAG TPA: GNAT family N-acetyltransferase [Dongiaceae bacterium]